MITKSCLLDIENDGFTKLLKLIIVIERSTPNCPMKGLYVA
jgi:hypothetical protein